MALTEVTLEITRSNNWLDPETGINWQIITGWEKWTNRHSEVKNRKWTLWSMAAILDVGEGDIMSVKGELNTKPDTWKKDGKETPVVDHSLFDYTVTSHNTSKRRGGSLLGVDQDDILKYGHPVFNADAEAPFQPLPICYLDMRIQWRVQVIFGTINT